MMRLAKHLIKWMYRVELVALFVLIAVKDWCAVIPPGLILQRLQVHQRA